MTIADINVTRARAGDHASINLNDYNASSSVPAINEYWFAKLYLVATKPVGTRGEYMVTRENEDKQYRIFLDTVKAQNHNLATKSFGPGQKSFGTIFADEILSQDQERKIWDTQELALFLAAKFFWTDGGGKHSNEACLWLEGVSLKQPLLTWHSCNNHNNAGRG
jgi:hypothetical protein